MISCAPMKPGFLQAVSILLLCAPCGSALAAGDAAREPNVLFIAIDDQNDWVGALGGHPLAKTPNLDRLAERGTVFLNAHCNAPLCNPSRTSLMLGLRPTTTGVYGLEPRVSPSIAGGCRRLTFPRLPAAPTAC